jgi:SWI/SNF-related matrix-associated actin-dependent regulator 1 of chromatin subfamily A
MVEGRNWHGNRFTIINYVILKNFYEVPTETIKQRELDLDESGRVINVTKEKEIVSRKQAIINEAMENSQLFQSRFDLIIVDEAHRLSNTSSGIFKIVTDLVKRSQPKGIYAITGTPITNRPINFFNILKVIDAPLSKDWKYYVERYCDGKSFFKKNERSAYTAIFLRDHHKRSWNELTKSEQVEMYDFLEKKCKKVWVTNGASNLDELQEVIKPYYLRRDKNDLKLVEKRVTTVEYELDDGERVEYDKAWDEYLKEKEANKNLPYKPLMEGIVFRQWLANTMCQRTISLVRKMVGDGLKVVVFCTFDEELHTIRDAFGDSCVVHNGKLTMKKKDEAVEKFQNDPSIKVFIGNIKSAGVGLTLTEATRVVFNSITFVPGDMQQAEDRIHRLNQTKPCEIYYQIFNGTYMEHMFGIVHDKSEIINTIIIRENEK